jgi:hypothetical protein
VGCRPADPASALPAGGGQLNVAGGCIKNIALRAAFLAADEGGPVGLGHLLRSARRERAKLERHPPSADIEGWIGPQDIPEPSPSQPAPPDYGGREPAFSTQRRPLFRDWVSRRHGLVLLRASPGGARRGVRL